MGLLDYADSARKKLRGLLGDMPIVQAAQGQANVSLDGLRNAMMAMRPFQGGADTAYEAALNIGPMALGKIVYHGSPHKFDKFDASKIGTGEGAQAYGHGVYLADSEGVAKTYTSVNQPAYLNAGVRAIVDDVMKEAAEKGLKGKEARLWANHEITRLAMERPEYARRQWFDAANNIDDILDKPVGSLYKADLPDEWIPKMLDWDKPVADLTVAEKKALQAAGARFADYWPNTQKVGDVLPKNERAAQSLQKAGIPGIRYLDGGSRGAGQGSYNYVVFPGLEGQVKILERNGVPINDGLLGRK